MSHYPAVADIWQAVEEWAPSSLAEEWDNVGLQAGDPAAPVRKLITALDVSASLIDFASSVHADMILTHHPLIFTPIRKLDLSNPVPRIISELIRKDIALASAHTNLDSAVNGVSDQLAAMLELSEVHPLIPAPGGDPATGLGRVGRLAAPLPFRQIVGRVCAGLGLPGVMATGDAAMVIEQVAVCGGSGSSLWPAFLESGAQLFLTAEIKHSVSREAEMLGLAVIDAGHFATEWPIVPVLARYMQERAAEMNWDMEVTVFSDEKMPATWHAAGLQE